MKTVILDFSMVIKSNLMIWINQMCTIKYWILSFVRWMRVHMNFACYRLNFIDFLWIRPGFTLVKHMCLVAVVLYYIVLIFSIRLESNNDKLHGDGLAWTLKVLDSFFFISHHRIWYGKWLAPKITLLSLSYMNLFD